MAKTQQSSPRSQVHLALASFVVLCLTGCNPLYVIHAAYIEGDILLRREKIADVISEPEQDDDLKRKLRLVLEARAFAEKSGFTVGDSYTYVTDLDEPPSWLLAAVAQESFTPYTWWFPIVGTVPYKGFFSKESAFSHADALEDDGYETVVRPVEAFSTLGWFNDPILSLTLERDDITIVETVFHELVHSTVWLPGSVAFNESLAQFIALEQTIRFYTSLPQKTHPEGMHRAQERRQSYHTFANRVSETYTKLEQLYKQDLSREEKQKQRIPLYTNLQEHLLREAPSFAIFEKPNNAELLGIRLYTKGYPIFDKLFRQLGSDPKKLLLYIQKRLSCYDNTDDVFTLLREDAEKEKTADELAEPCTTSFSAKSNEETKTS